MATRQYIGARYVIKIYENSLDQSSAEWEAGVTYEPLTMVTYNNSSYLSKKNVPGSIGDPASNPEYWVVTGAYNGQILNLQNQIDDMNDGTVPGSLQNQIDDLNAGASHNIIVIGNSFVNEGVANALIADFDHSYKYVGSGIGFCPYSGHTTTFEDELDAAIADSAFNNDSITDILFVSAMGDTLSFDENVGAYSSNLLTTLASIRTKIENNFTNCKRVMITLAETRSVAKNSYMSKYSTLFAIHRLFVKIVHQYNMQYLGWSGFNVMLEGSQYTLSDGYHPSALGSTFIGSFIKDSYYGHAEYITKYTVAHIDFKYTASATLTTVVKFSPTQVQINNWVVSDTAGSAVTIGSGSVIASFSELPKPIPPCSDYYVYCTTELTNEATGAKLDYLILEIGDTDSDGIATIKLINAPSASTIGAAKCSLPSANNITYFI